MQACVHVHMKAHRHSLVLQVPAPRDMTCHEIKGGKHQESLHSAVQYRLLHCLCRHNAADLFSLITTFKPLLDQRFLELCSNW